MGRQTPKAEIEDLPDGTRIVRHPDGSVSHSKPFPSGKAKRLDRYFGPDGQLQHEVHLYGFIDISIDSTFENGVKTGETYIVKRRLVSRKTYEKARLQYPDMPPADPSLQDSAADLLRAARKEHQWESAARKSHVPDPAAAAKSDAFCRKLMGRGKHADAIEWIKTKNHTLGEMSQKAGRGLVSTLSRLGCLRIVACEIDDYGNGAENTGHLVVELPTGPKQRTAVFKQLARLAHEQGFSGDPDNGQKLAYIKLD
jgi:hypothetical protein